MNELAKINKIIERESGNPAVETLLVLDATTGFSFNDFINLS